MKAFFENLLFFNPIPPPKETANVSKHKLIARIKSSNRLMSLRAKMRVKNYFFLKINRPKNVIAAQTAISENPKLNTKFSIK